MTLQPPDQQQPEQQRDLQQQLETAGLIAIGVTAWLAKEIASAIANSNLLVDQSPSTCVALAIWNPVTETVNFDFHKGGSYHYPCDKMTWAAYKNAPSKGGFFNDYFADR